MKNYLLITLSILSILKIGFTQNHAHTFSNSGNSSAVATAPSLFADMANSDFTVECWIRPYDVASASTWTRLMDIAHDNDNFVQINITDDPELSHINFTVEVGGTQYKVLSNQPIVAYRWYHLALVWDASEATIYAYIDGILQTGSISSTVGAGSGVDKTSLGKRYGATLPTSYYSGEMDEIRIWSDMRTQNEIRKYMYSEVNTSSSNLLVYYKCNELYNNYTRDNATGDAAYDATSDYNYAVIASAAFYGPAQCMHFDGTDDYINCGATADQNNSGKITLETWVKLESGTDDYSRLIYRAKESGDQVTDAAYALTLGPGNKVRFTIQGAYAVTTESLNTDTWYHIAATYDNSLSSDNMKIYIDGKLVKTANRTQSIYQGNDFPVLLGSSLNGATASYPLKGYLDDVRVWNSCRTADEIRLNMCNVVDVNESDLAYYWKLDYVDDNSISPNADGIGSGEAADGNLMNGMTSSNLGTSRAFFTALNQKISASYTNPYIWSFYGDDPSASDNVMIIESPYAPIPQADITVKNFVNGLNSYFGTAQSVTLNGNAWIYNSFDIYSDKTLTVAGDLYYGGNSNDPMVLKSGACLMDNGNVSGDFKIERSLSNDQWHLVSMPVDQGTSASFLDQFLMQYQESDNSWSYITETNTPLSVGKGYALYSQSKSNSTYSFTGTPNTGDITVSLSYHANGTGYAGGNLLGNPYPSSILWTAVNSELGYGSMYVWSDADDQYLAWPADDGYGTAPSPVIPPFQGFFIVIPSNGPGSFTFTNDLRIPYEASNFYKSNHSLQNGLMLVATSGEKRDLLLIRQDANASAYFELEKDALKLPANSEGKSEIYTISDQTELSIDVRNEVDIIQLGYRNTVNGNYQIQIKEIDGFAGVELEDTKLNQFHDLNKSAYSFDWNKDDSEERFILHLSATGTEDLEAQAVQVYAAQQKVYISLNEPEKYQQMQIFDITGRQIAEYNLNSENLQSFPINQAEGTYLILLSGENQSITKKVIIK